MTFAISDTTLGAGEQPVANTDPPSMSFPAILRASKLADRFAHLKLASVSDEPTSDVARLAVKKNKNEIGNGGPDGRRTVRFADSMR